MEEIMPLVKSVTPEGMIADATASYEWLASEAGADPARIAATGFCMGGRASYFANSELKLAAAISYYAGGLVGEHLSRAGSLHGPHLFFWGGEDKGIPPEQHRALTDAVRSAEKKFVDVEFSDCNHAFFNEQTDRYDESAAKQSWAIGVEFLRNSLSWDSEA